jgi:hypothetical protein
MGIVDGKDALARESIFHGDDYIGGEEMGVVGGEMEPEFTVMGHAIDDPGIGIIGQLGGEAELGLEFGGGEIGPKVERGECVGVLLGVFGKGYWGIGASMLLEQN